MGGVTSAESENSDEEEDDDEGREAAKERKQKGKLGWDSSSITY